MNYNIFISYAGKDNNLAQLLYASIGRVVQFKPYKAENYLSFEEEFKLRIQNEIINSSFIIVLLTKHGKSSQFVNQELGFALAVKTIRRNLKGKFSTNLDTPIIIPVSQKGLKLKGFITKDSNDLLFLDKYASQESFSAEIIACIRHFIPNGEKGKTLTVRVTCPGCHNKDGLPLTFEGYLPAVAVLWNLIKNQEPLRPKCPNCGEAICINPSTLAPIKFES